MSEESYIASRQARFRYHDPDEAFGREFNEAQDAHDAMLLEHGLRNLGPAPKEQPQQPAEQPQVNQDGSTKEQNLAKQKMIRDRQRGALDLQDDQAGRAAGFVESAAENVLPTVEQLGVGIIKGTGSALSAYFEHQEIEKDMTGLASLIAAKFNLPTLNSPDNASQKFVQDIGRYGVGFAGGTAIAKTAGLSWGYGQMLFADAFAEFAAFDGDTPNLADAVGLFKDFKPDFATELRADFVELLGKDADASELEERTKNAIANSGFGVAADGAMFLSRAVPFIFNTSKQLVKNPALMKEAFRLGLEAKRARAEGMVNSVAEAQRAASQELMGSIAAIAEAASKNLQGAKLTTGPGSQRGMVAFHGSPHAFDAFDIAKVNSGQGAQAQGHGMYFAQNNAVARGYQTSLSDVDLVVDGKPVPVPDAPGGDPAGEFLSRLKKEAAQNLRDNPTSPNLDEFTDETIDNVITQMKVAEGSPAWTLAQSFKGKSIGARSSGHVYEVDIPDEQVARMLDLDKPMTEQAPEVQEALVNAGLWSGKTEAGAFNGSAFYKKLSERFAPELPADPPGTPDGWGFVQRGDEGDRAASEILDSIGIPGNKYLDANSRGKGEGTRNLVVFNPADVQILSRNGKPVTSTVQTPSGRLDVLDDGEIVVSSTAGKVSSIKDVVKARLSSGELEPLPMPDGSTLTPGMQVRSATALLNEPPMQFGNLYDRGTYLQERAQAALGGKRMDKPPAKWTPQDKDDIATLMVADLNEALKHPENAAKWYDEHVKRAHRMAATKYPEILTDRPSQRAFNFALAVTSQGLDVATNGKLGLQAYEAWKKSGRFPDTIKGEGKAAHVMRKSFATYNQLLDDMGEANLDTFLRTKFKVSDMKALGVNVPSELVSAEVYGSTLFGPKIGGAFFSNLEGRFDMLTMDKWWARTWGRYTGTLMADPKKAKSMVAKFREAAAADPEWRKRHGISQRQLRTHQGTLDAAAKTYNGFATGRYNDGTRAAKGYADKDVELHKQARAIFMGVLNPDETMNGASRALMREVAELARQKMVKDGVDLNIADIQALLWYLEKDIYANLGQTVSRVAFDDAVYTGMKLRGVDDATLENAKFGRTAGGPAADGGGAGGRDDAATAVAGRSNLDEKQLLERVSESLQGVAE